MIYINENYQEAERQLASLLHKLKETLKTLEAKEFPQRYQSQITLAKRRIDAIELSLYLIDNEINQS